MTTSPTARSLQECRRLGYVAGVVEKWNPHAKIRQDLWGWGDIVALIPAAGLEWNHALGAWERVGPTANAALCFIQATTGEGGSHAARVAKIRAWPHLADLLATGARVEVWSWAKRGARGKRKLWTLRREPVSASVQHGASQKPTEADGYPVARYVAPLENVGLNPDGVWPIEKVDRQDLLDRVQPGAAGEPTEPVVRKKHSHEAIVPIGPERFTCRHGHSYRHASLAAIYCPDCKHGV